MASSKPTEKIQSSRGELFLVATPIGHLKDITLRALEVLQSVDRIACEDTRTSGVLLKHYGIKVPLTAYHTHNEAQSADHLVAQLVAGARIALISDAGTPLLSDPGARLVEAAVAAGIRVTPIPGASALLSAITIAGLPAGQFFYAGFLPTKTGARAAALTQLITIPATLVFYEAPHRLVATLNHLAEIYGPRDAAVARELTKMHEECIRAPLPELAAHYEAKPPKGECVIVVAGAPAAAAMDDAAIDAALQIALRTLHVNDAAAMVAKDSGRAKRDVYARALALKEKA
ncbi:MAG: 16S rRNA (cytidine(1402)-2'-O)-methyltransferase [Pseudomonadota bacterium]